MSNLPKNCVFVFVLSFVLLFSLSIPSVKADIIHGEFTGEIGWLSIINNPHSFYLEQTLTGWFTYNRDTTDSNPDPGVGMYELSAPSEIYVIIQGIRYGTDEDNPQFYMGTYNDREVSGGTAFVDQVWFQTGWLHHTRNDLYINFVDNRAEALTDDELPGVAPWLMPILGNNGGLAILDENGQIAAAQMSIVWVVSEPSSPEEKLLEIFDFFDESVKDGTLVPVKPGNAGEGQLNAVWNMIVEAGVYIETDLLEEACIQLQAALEKTDGLNPPESAPDFVKGPAAAELANMIQDLMDSLGC